MNPETKIQLEWVLKTAIKCGHHKIRNAIWEICAREDIHIDGETPLSYALKVEDYDVAFRLIQKGYEKESDCALFSVLNSETIDSEDKEEIGLLFIIAGCEIKKVDETGRSPLMYAILNSQTGIATKLIDMECTLNLDLEDSNGETPLMMAIAENQTEIGLKLIEAGCEIKKQFNGQSMLIHAIRENEEEIALKLIEKKCDVNLKDDKGKTPLIHAICEKQIQTALKLIKDEKCDLNLKDEKTCDPPLMFAMKTTGCEEITSELMKSPKCDINQNALVYAIKNHQTKLALDLIEFGCTIHKKNRKWKNNFFLLCVLSPGTNREKINCVLL